MNIYVETYHQVI